MKANVCVLREQVYFSCQRYITLYTYNGAAFVINIDIGWIDLVIINIFCTTKDGHLRILIFCLVYYYFHLFSICPNIENIVLYETYLKGKKVGR